MQTLKSLSAYSYVFVHAQIYSQKLAMQTLKSLSAYTYVFVHAQIHLQKSAACLAKVRNLDSTHRHKLAMYRLLKLMPVRHCVQSIQYFVTLIEQRAISRISTFPHKDINAARISRISRISASHTSPDKKGKNGARRLWGGYDQQTP